ncbi:RNA polymerase sigma factor [Ideonella sp. BN130291]|uniref:RNA polymerase sigma factor n=1 Tax=Ideonella sp. BN130291 TaxID=3112940 RepID=UPI002E254AAF|nr:RNA polymerase sigma factor [Ideonella sp. BN130291]
MSSLAPRMADDAALLAAMRAGDASAFEQLMRRYNRRLYRVARAMLKDDAEAEDAVQEAYLCAYRSAAAFRGDSAIATWLTRIVVNECTSRLRRSTRRHNIVPIVAGLDAELEERTGMPDDLTPPDIDAPERALMRAEMRALLEAKIDELPQDYRTVFMMRAVEELSVEETAQCLGIPEATVRTRHFRARSLLRESIAQEIDVAQRGAFDFDGERCDRIVQGVLQAVRNTP